MILPADEGLWMVYWLVLFTWSTRTVKLLLGYKVGSC